MFSSFTYPTASNASTPSAGFVSNNSTSALISQLGNALFKVIVMSSPISIGLLPPLFNEASIKRFTDSVISLTPSINVSFNASAGAYIGAFLATDKSSSVKSLVCFSTLPLLSFLLYTTLVCASNILLLNFLNLPKFIFLGGFKLSVQNNKLSIIFIPVIKLFFEKFNTPAKVYVNDKFMFPKSFPLYSIFLKTNLSSSFLRTVFLGIDIFIYGSVEDTLKLFLTKVSEPFEAGMDPHKAFNSASTILSKVNSFSSLDSTVTAFKVLVPFVLISIKIGETEFWS